MIDTAPLLRKVAELAEELERDYGPEACLTAAVVVVEVEVDAGDDECTIVIEHRGTTSSTAHALGLVTLAGDSLREPFERGDD